MVFSMNILDVWNIPIDWECKRRNIGANWSQQSKVPSSNVGCAVAQLRSKNMLHISTHPNLLKATFNLTHPPCRHEYLPDKSCDVRYTKFCTADGQIMYKSETPGFLHAGKKTTIYKVIPNDDPEEWVRCHTFIAFTVPSQNPLTQPQLTDSQNWQLLTGVLLSLQNWHIMALKCRWPLKGSLHGGNIVPFFVHNAGLIHDLVSTRQRIFTAPDDGRLFKWTLEFQGYGEFDDKQWVLWCCWWFKSSEVGIEWRFKHGCCARSSK